VLRVEALRARAGVHVDRALLRVPATDDAGVAVLVAGEVEPAGLLPGLVGAFRLLVLLARRPELLPDDPLEPATVAHTDRCGRVIHRSVGCQ
jgi:hypothetical protein